MDQEISSSRILEALRSTSIIIADTYNDRLVFLSSIDLSFLFSIGKQGSRPGEFLFPSGVAIDDDRHRIIVTDSDSNRVQVLSSIDGSFLFEFGSKGNQPCQFNDPHGVCIANQGRIIVADFNNKRLNHSLTKAITSHRSIVTSKSHWQSHSTSIEVSSPSRQAIECM